MIQRVVAIIHENKNADISQLVEIIAKAVSNVYVFSYSADETYSIEANCNIKTILIPDDKNTRVLRKNFVTRYFKDGQICKYLHVIEDVVEILKDPTTFMNDIENMMNVYDVNSYCGTITDTCNYVYQKYNPRINVEIDSPSYLKFNLGNAIFCSHANVQWVVFDIENGDETELYFNEEYCVDMYFIIEYLAKRRNTHPGSMYFMNQYFTCKSEYGVYRINQNIKPETTITNKNMHDNDQIFKKNQVDYTPDNNIDIILIRLYDKLTSKL